MNGNDLVEALRALAADEADRAAKHDLYDAAALLDVLLTERRRVHRLSSEVLKGSNRTLDVYKLNRALRGGEDKQQ